MGGVCRTQEGILIIGKVNGERVCHSPRGNDSKLHLSAGILYYTKITTPNALLFSAIDQIQKCSHYDVTLRHYEVTKPLIGARFHNSK